MAEAVNFGPAAKAGWSAAAQPSPRYAGYVLAILLLTYTSGWIDRGIMGILGQAIKEEMKLADWQLGLMTGFAFSIFYSVLGFPLARIAERRSRVNLLAICLVLWSGLTALCGLATSFAMLLLLRCGVGVGEAGCAPGCHSLLTDHFAPAKRTMAFSVYGLGVPLGQMLGAIAGGVLTQYVGWRFALIAVGVPGLLLALVIKLTVKEPVRGRMEPEGAAAEEAGATPSLMDAWRVLFSKPTFRHIAAALCIFITGTGASAAFLGPYYIREFHLNYAEVGLIIGILMGVTSIFGTMAGGWLTQRLATKNPRWYMLTPALGLAIGAPLTFAAYLQENWMGTAGLLLLAALFQAVYLAPSFAVTHNMVSPRMRATAAATVYFFMNIIGMSMGPVIAGLGIDLFAGHLFGQTGLGSFSALCPGGVAIPGSTESVRAACASSQAEGTRWVLLLTSPMILWGALHYYLASRTVARDLRPGTA